MSFNRRLAILEWLKTGERVPLRKMQERFGVSKRMLLYDFAFLSGYPITSYLGRNGGYEWTGERELPITPKDAARIVALAEREQTLDPETGALIKRLRTFCEQEEK